MDSWEEYFGHLSSTGLDAPLWEQKRIDLLIKLLSAIGASLGYHFNAAEMNRIYFPTAHGNMFADQDAIRRGVAALLKGESALPMAVKEFPGSPEPTAAQAATMEKISQAYAKDGSLKVTITGDR
jgi:hypothetical protein